MRGWQAWQALHPAAEERVWSAWPGCEPAQPARGLGSPAEELALDVLPGRQRRAVQLRKHGLLRPAPRLPGSLRHSTLSCFHGSDSLGWSSVLLACLWIFSTGCTGAASDFRLHKPSRRAS